MSVCGSINLTKLGDDDHDNTHHIVVMATRRWQKQQLLSVCYNWLDAPTCRDYSTRFDIRATRSFF